MRLAGSTSTPRARLTAIALAVLGIATMLSLAPAAPAAAASRFSDVPSSHQFHREIQWLADMRVTTGYADGTFRPQDSVSREAFAAFLYRLNGSPRVSLPSRSPFSDVPSSAQFYKEIVWLSQQRITNGWSDGTFRPRAKISREAVAAFLFRLAGKPDERGSHIFFPFVDISSGTQFEEEIMWLQSVGLTTGYAGGTFRPKEDVSRAAIAAFLYRGSEGLRRAGEGSYTVGEQVFPGTYIADAHGSNFCDWEKWDASRDRVTAWSSTPVRGIATITADDPNFDSRTCGTWRPLRATSPRATSFGEGTFVAGYHMRPGTYEAPGSATCYRAGYASFTGRDDLFDVGWGDESTPRIRVTSGQGIASIGCGTWKRVGN